MTYEAINASIHSIDWNALNTKNALVPPTQSERVRRIVIAWRAVRPATVFAARLPIIPAAWQVSGQAFIGLLDGLAEDVGATPDFKAGKDL